MVAVAVTGIAQAYLENLCDAWLYTALPLQEFVRTWVVPAGLVAATAFALGIPAVGFALCGTIVGATIGEPVGGGFFRRAPFGAALGASLGTGVGGLLGLRVWRSTRASGSASFSWSLRSAAVVTLCVGMATAWRLPGMIAATDPVCRAPAFGSICHRDVIAWLLAADAGLVALLLVLAARDHARTAR